MRCRPGTKGEPAQKNRAIEQDDALAKRAALSLILNAFGLTLTEAIGLPHAPARDLAGGMFRTAAFFLGLVVLLACGIAAQDWRLGTQAGAPQVSQAQLQSAYNRIRPGITPVSQLGMLGLDTRVAAKLSYLGVVEQLMPADLSASIRSIRRCNLVSKPRGVAPPIFSRRRVRNPVAAIKIHCASDSDGQCGLQGDARILASQRARAKRLTSRPAKRLTCKPT